MVLTIAPHLGLLNSLIGLPQTEVGVVVTVTILVDAKYGLAGSLLLRRLGLPVVGKKSTAMRYSIEQVFFSITENTCIVVLGCCQSSTNH